MPVFGTVFLLNLPRKVSKGTGSLEYIYDAAGSKLAKILNGTVVNFYCGSVVYTGSKAVEYVAHPEGIAHKSGSGFSYQYNQTDHLGNVRSVADASKAVVQATDYFPFGLAHSTSNLTKNKYLYNGKELQNDVVGGTPFGQLDYGARMYDATLGVWRSIDPLAEKYFAYSPYNYCVNNPIMFVDPDGKDGRVTGSGTKEDPYVIEAIYYYDEANLGQEQIDGLNAAVAEYNNRGTKMIKDKGSKVHVKYNLSAQGVEDPNQARMDNTGFKTTTGSTMYYGNVVGTAKEGDEYGSANKFRVDFNVPNIAAGVAAGMDPSALNKGVMIHEIGHNLGGEHSDGTSVMSIVNTTEIGNLNGSVDRLYSYPKMSDKFTPIIFNRRDTQKVSVVGKLWVQKNR